jgi:hypothetical protein
MTWEEWDQLKANAADKGTTAMQLNRVPDSDGAPPPGGDLKVDQQDLAAVGDAAFRLFDRLGRQGRDAWSVSQGAARDLRSQGFALGDAIDHVQERWEAQLKTLLDACAHVSNHMDFTQGAHAGDEHYIYDVVSSIATLDAGFTERTQR